MVVNILVALVVLSLSMTATNAGAEDTQGQQYSRTYECSFATVRTTGARCEDEDTCPNLSMVYSETVTLVSKGLATKLRPITVQFAGSPRVDTTRVYALSEVRCHADNEITLVYWGGGNCSSVCVVAVRYTISDSGAVVKNEIVQGGWLELPAAKEY